VCCSSASQQCVVEVGCELRSCEKAQVLEHSVLQCVAAVCGSSVLKIVELREGAGVTTQFVLQQCVAAVCCRSVLQQCVAAVCCKLRSCENTQALERSVLQFVAVCCKWLQ